MTQQWKWWWNMLVDLLRNLADAKTKSEKETAYRNLERVGMDRSTANFMLNILGKRGK
jgi:hypothetical protein